MTAEQPRPADDPTIGRLVADASRDISALVQSEIALAKSEIRFSAKAGGIGAAMFVVAGFFGLLITVMLSIAVAYFLVMAGLGYDAAIMADTVDVLKDRMGWLAYVEAGIRKLPGKPVRARISIDGAEPVRRRIRSVMVGNCGRIMGGIEIFPDAKVDDGVLDLLILSPRGRLGWLGVIAGIFGRNKNETESVDYFQGKTAEITLDHEQEFQLDGDHLGTGKHLAVTVEPDALKIRMAAA